MDTGPRVVLLHAAEDLDFVGRLVGELRYLSGNYSLPQTDICQQVTGTPGDLLTHGSVKLVVPVISRHLLADQSSLTVGLETAVRNNKPRYVIWLDQNKDDFREFGTLVSRQYPTLEAPARRVQRDRVWETMPGSVVRGMLGIAWDMNSVLCRQTGELRWPCWYTLFHNRAFLADNMNLSAVLTRLEQENQLSPDEVWDIEDNPLFVVFEPTPLRRGARLVEMLKERSRQEPYDWLVRVLREEGQDFLAEKMEEQEGHWARQYGIGEQQAAQPGQQTAQTEHFTQQSQGRKKRAHSAEGSDSGQSTPSEHGRPVRRQLVSSHIAGTRSHFQYIVAPYWKDLAFFLGFGSAAVSNITHRNPDDESCYMDMLEEWKKLRGEEATTQVLKAALSEADLQGVLRARGLTERAFPELADNSGSTDEPGEAGPSDSASGELRYPCTVTLFHNRGILYDNMNLPAVLTRLEQENKLSPAEVRDIQDNPVWVLMESKPARLVPRLVEMLDDRRRQEPYDWFVRVLREEGQDFLAEKMEEQERHWARHYGIGEQLATQPGQQTAQREHFSQQSQGRNKRAYGTEGSDGGTRSYFHDIKEAVAPYWKNLAFFLGFGSAAVSDIAHRNPDDESRYMDMLEEWKKLRGEEATTQVFKAALSEAGLQLVLEAHRLKRAFPELADNSGSTDVPGEVGPSDGASALPTRAPPKKRRRKRRT
ncbi:uncharacterized protein LOC118411837 [Branchiostoma floridae]|uniref:Uncharacterized protein LOC118411837 n=1 Tax=Branchiostoma floridae TaxID=7739 RepID=A0A9J7KTV8_BRAFL|nr:uncharacterized protein LOC118411837 [Branchiostoma floridae]